MVPRFLLAGLGSISLLAATSAAPPTLADPIAGENGAIRVVPRVPFGKTLVVPISAADPDGDSLAFRVSSDKPGVFVAVRSGNPILRVHVEYAGGQGPPESAPFSGDLDFQLFRDLAPITAGHIGGLAQAGYYNNLIFHRIIPGFVAQGGDPAGNGSGLSDPNNPNSFIGLPYGFEHEFRPSLIFSGRGQLAMANSNGGYNRGNHTGSGLISLGDFSATNGSQFFITYAQPRHLDFKHTIFGQLIRGFDLLDKMATVPRDAGDKPVIPVRMTSVTLHPGVTDATLTVSAIDLGPSIITLTATDPGGASASRSFVVNVEEDDFNDPPVLRPIPNLLAPVGQRPELPLRAFDLEQDYLLYGIATVSGNPQAGSFGFAQIASTFAPRSSPGFQDLGVGVAGFNDARLNDEASAASPFAPFEPYNFQVAELAYGDRPISVIGRALHADAGAAFADVIVAHFRDADVAGQLADFSAIVNWGDGTAENSSAETAPRVKIERSATEPGGFVVKASHTYARAGIYLLRVTIDAPLGATGITTTQAIVAQTATGVRAEGRDLGRSTSRIDNRVIATFTAESGTARDWSALINWGDGGVSAGVIRRLGADSFAIRGSHQYRNSGAEAIQIQLRGPTLDPAGAIAWSAVDIAGGELPRSLPPFAMPHLVGQIGGVPVDPSNAGGAQKEFKATVGSGANSQTFFTASIVIVNAGNEKSRESSLRFYLSTDGTLNLTPVTNPDNSTTPADIPLKIGSFPKGRIPALKAGDGLRYNFDTINGEDLRLAAPRGETGAGLFLLSSFDYTDDVADHMPIDREVQFGPINGIIVTPLRLQVTELAGTTHTGSFTVRLDRAPLADVKIPISVADTNELTSDKNELVFTIANWNTPQTVTVTAIDDTAKESFESVEVRLNPSVSTDPRWDKMDGADVTVSIQDND